MTTAAIIGTGNVGAALGARLARSGVSVRFGAREGTDPAPLLERAGENAVVVPVAEATKGVELVFLAVPAMAAVDATRDAGIEGQILVDCTNPVRWDQGPVWSPPPEGSVAAALAAGFPEARVVKAFNTFGAEFHAEPHIDADHAIDIFMASDDTDAKPRSRRSPSRPASCPSTRARYGTPASSRTWPSSGSTWRPPVVRDATSR